jgi:hypothetical protein
MSHADRFEVEALEQLLEMFENQLKAVNTELIQFGSSAPAAEQEARALLDSRVVYHDIREFSARVLVAG